MVQSSRKRRSRADPDDSDAVSPRQRRRTQNASVNGESSAQGARRNRRPREEEEEEDDDVDVDVDDDEVDHAEVHGSMNKARLVKNVVRLALAHEYTRQPIRRNDITTKALGTASRQFKEIFSAAQDVLRSTFGMELVELPTRDAGTRTNLAARRKASERAAAASAPASSKQYTLSTVLPAPFRDAEILQPFGTKEQGYTGLVTLVVCLIYLNGRVLPAARLARYLRRLGADEYAPLLQEKTEKVLATMQRQGYVVRVKDTAGDETSYDYHLGPRAKTEIGTDGVVNMIRAVYGANAPEDLEDKILVNVGVDLSEIAAGEDGADLDGLEGVGAPPQRKRRSARRRANAQDDDDDYV